MGATLNLLCEERDHILLDPGTGIVADDWEVYAGLTDPDGTFGAPRVSTTWGQGRMRMQDIRYPNPDGGADRFPCDHYFWLEEAEDEETDN